MLKPFPFSFSLPALLLPPVIFRSKAKENDKGERSAFAGWRGGGDAI